MAELYYDHSPFNFALSNPLRYIDPNGKWTYDASGNASTSDANEIREAVNQLKNGSNINSIGNSNSQKDKGNNIDKITEKNKKNISISSWGETSGLYPIKGEKPTNRQLFDPTKWDLELIEELLKARAAVNLVSTRNKDHKESKPNLASSIEKMLAAYHLTDNFPDVDSEIKDDNTVKYFYLASDKNAKTPSIDSRYWSQVTVMTYGPFYNIGGGDVPKGSTYIHFYKAIKKTTK